MNMMLSCSVIKIAKISHDRNKAQVSLSFNFAILPLKTCFCIAVKWYFLTKDIKPLLFPLEMYIVRKSEEVKLS
jgi:hypothetical protein